MAEYDWKTKWKKKASDGREIKWCVETPDGFAVRFLDGGVYTTDHDGICKFDTSLSLIPIPSPPRYWSKAGDVDPLIDRIRWKTCDVWFTGCIVVYKDGSGIDCIGFGSEPKKTRYLWSEMPELEYRRIGESTWRPCTTTSERA